MDSQPEKNNWEAFFNMVIKLKIPSLVIIIVFIIPGYFLIDDYSNHGELLSGIACFIASFIFSVFFFVSWQIRRYYESIIERHEKSLNTVISANKKIQKSDIDRTENENNLKSELEKKYKISSGGGGTASNM